MTGIYMFTNKINNKKYVGQSVDCDRRFQEHRRAAHPEKYCKTGKERDFNTPIHKAFQKYGFDNFSYEILEECSRAALNERERYWIQYYQTTNRDYGYNLSEGGQDCVGASGEFHSQAKLTQQEVNAIKELLLHSDLSLTEIQQLHPSVGKSMICLINTGKNWKDNNLTYPLRQFSALRGQYHATSLFSNEEVMQMRTMYSQGIPSRDIVNIYKNYSPNTIKAILYGRSYKYLPYWSKTKNQWIIRESTIPTA